MAASSSGAKWAGCCPYLSWLCSGGSSRSLYAVDSVAPFNGTGSEKGRVRVAQWNLAGVNSSPVEFLQTEAVSNPSLKTAVLLLGGVNELVGAVIGNTCNGDARAERLCKISQAELLKPIADLVHESELARLITEQADLPSTPFVDTLRTARAGEKIFGKVDLEFGRRGFGFMRLAPGNVEEFANALLEACRGGRRGRFWRQWLRGVQSGCPHATSEQAIPKVVLLAAMEAFVFEAGKEVANSQGAHGKDLVESLTAFVAAMSCDECSKARQLVRTLGNVYHRCRPDAFMLQEFSESWLELEDFSRFWKSTFADYVLIKPVWTPEPFQVTHLLIRHGGALTVDAGLTKRAKSLAMSVEFTERLRPRFRATFGVLAQDQLTAATGKDGFLRTKLAFAVCLAAQRWSWLRGRKRLLVVAAHATSAGTDNRAVVLVALALAQEMGCELLMGLDANSAAQFDEKDLARGAATQHDFVTFLNDEHLRHCFQHLPDEVADPNRFHTVSKCRTYLQCQVHKAMKRDRSAKDWVLASDRQAHLTGIRMNKTAVLAQGLGRPLEEEAWSGEITMPTPDFPSDHALVLADLSIGD